MKVENLKMIGFGTKGDDGIDEGIHLRWSFNDKLGFPSCFKLYRRKSNLKNKFEFPINGDDNLVTIGLPYTFKPKPHDSFKFRIDSAKTNNQEINSLIIQSETLEDGTSADTLLIDGEVTLLFSKPVSRIELKFVLEDSSDFKIKMLSTEGSYYPYQITGEVTGLQNLSFDTVNTTGMVLSGTAIKLNWLAAWTCKNGKGWKRINSDCGCGLPVNQEGSRYVNEVYPDSIDRDLATALCRLGDANVASSQITTAEFVELKSMLLTMTEEGNEVPVGWTLFPNEADEEENEETTTADETLEFSKYDFLLTQSLHVFFAKILDLYFVDTDADNNTFYDYKITAKWPEWNKRRLDHEITFDQYEVIESPAKIKQLDKHVVLLATANPQIVESSYPFFRTVKGVEITTENIPAVISFLQPVTEVQLVLINPDFGVSNEIVVEAYENLFSAYVDREVLAVDRGILRLRAKQIDYIKIHAPSVIICRIHYDFEPYPEDLQKYIICGVLKHTHLPLPRPTDLTASFLPGGTHNDQDGNITEKPYMAGLRWKVNENPVKELISIAPVLYHIEKKPEGGTIELLTEEAPLFVSPTVIDEELRNVPIGWPEDRQYYMDTITLGEQNSYRVSALDLFGRQSVFADPETYEIKLPKSPHPIDVVAKFLDYSTYNPADQSFADTTINIDDKDWLETNGKNAIVVRWKWPVNLQLQAPDVDGFKIYCQPGWLNTYTGIITTDPVQDLLTKTSLIITTDELHKFPILEESPEDIRVYKFEIALDLQLPPAIDPLPDDTFRLCWLTQGNHSFLILKNTGGNQANLWVLRLNDLPVKNQGFGIAVTPDKEFFINYQDPGQWSDTRISHDESKNGNIEEYTVYIENPDFPNPAIGATDRNKVRYAQIGVNSYIENIEGSVSPASTIIAIYRDAPAASTAFAPFAGTEIQALKATPADIHGKSFFALRWGKTNLGLKHHVFRALDETLFKVDNANRPTRVNTVYDDFMDDFADEVIVIQNIPYESDPLLVGSHYVGLTPGQLQILACLPDNENAFTKINDGIIDETDPLYQDRITEIPDPVTGPAYSPNPDTLLYLDKTLSGQSSNRYFYALRSVDANGLQSVLSLATPPVEIPKTTPPPVPVITAVNGGENKVTLKWAKNPGAAIAGYLVYRTQDIKNTRDWRKMDLIKANDADAFTVAVNGSLPDKEFEFADESAIARQAYYYGVVAVGLNDEGKWLPSRISQAVVGQGWDLTPPEPPLIVNLNWISIEESTGMEYPYTESPGFYAGAKIEWESQENLEYLVQLKNESLSDFSNASDWLDENTNDFVHRNSLTYLEQEYRILVRGNNGLLNLTYSVGILDKINI